MDRISAVLIFGIIVLTLISSHIVYETWIKNDEPAYELLILNGGEEEVFEDVIEIYEPIDL